ncbi:restriction endonuclease subunit S [Vibrio parahaemolyticus]|nr:restriction endonuclease subunit S [Vibrio parahaemolyticus]
MTGRYKAYAEYKDSGVEFAPKIPVDWAVSKVSYISTFGRGLNITKANLEDEGVPCVSYGEVHSKYGFEVDPNKHSLKCVSPTYIETSSFALLLKGDFVFADTSEDIEGSGNFTQLVSDEALFAGYHTVIVRPEVNNYYRFLSYLFDSCEFRAQIRGAVKGVKVFSVTQAILKNANVWLPKYEEQQKIANFLDHETAKIDTLIAKQEKLIELLKEKRQTVISHAVTKGLNPDAPMKDSGVEWLGDVPEHWAIIPLKHLCRFSGGGTPTKDNLIYWTNGTIPWVSPKDMKSQRVTQTSDYITEKAVVESSTNYVDSGALLMVVRSGILQRTIPVAINDVVVTLNQDMKALKFNQKMAVDFALHFIVGNEKALLLEWSKEGATVESIEHEYLANGLLPVPPMPEQLSIVQYLSTEMEKFSQLETRAILGIELLKERKTALISAAVTGKIDVRDWQEPTYQESAQR